MEQEPKVTITVTVAEAEMILNALAELPYRLTSTLVPRLVQEVESQLDGPTVENLTEED